MVDTAALGADAAASAADNVEHPDVAATVDQFTSRFVSSDNLMISCGCVPIDLKLRKIAILHDINTGVTQLPKGRKNIGEDLHKAALRETCEETGIQFDELPLRISTRATPTKEMEAEGVPSHMAGITRGITNCEPSSVCVYRCESTLAFKIVFWFAAQGDSTSIPNSDTKEAWETNLKLEWVDAQVASSKMTFEADGNVIKKVLMDMRNSGYAI